MSIGQLVSKARSDVADLPLPARFAVSGAAVLGLLGVVAMLMLVAKPGTGDPVPAFAPGAGLLFGTSLFLAGTAVADIVTSLRRPSPAPSAHGSADRSAQ